MRTLVVLLLLAACGGSTPAVPPAPTGPSLHIVNYAYVPQRLEVTPGSVVVVINDDPVQHSVTSAAAPGTFTFGDVSGVHFDTGPFTGTRPIEIAADAPIGTVVPYFCWLHAGAMANQGEIVVVAPP